MRWCLISAPEGVLVGMSCGFGRRLLNGLMGLSRPILSLENRTAETFQKLMDRLPLAETYHTDRYRVYDAFSRRHRVIGKGGKVNRNEGLHSRLRDSL